MLSVLLSMVSYPETIEQIAVIYSIPRGAKMDSEKEKEINDKMERLADEYLEKEIKNATRDYVENLTLVFTYKKTANLVKLSENLVKHSKRLTCWTIVIAIFTIVLGASTIWSIVDKYLL